MVLSQRTNSRFYLVWENFLVPDLTTNLVVDVFRQVLGLADASEERCIANFAQITLQDLGASVSNSSKAGLNNSCLVARLRIYSQCQISSLDALYAVLLSMLCALLARAVQGVSGVAAVMIGCYIAFLTAWVLVVSVH